MARRSAIKTIEQATGVTINHYVEVSFAGFVKMVDAVGTRHRLQPDCRHRQGLWPQAHKGQNVLNSTEAMAYVRARHAFATQDLARIDHQQQFLAALFKAATARQILLNPFKLNHFLGAALSSVTVDNHLSKASLLALAHPDALGRGGQPAVRDGADRRTTTIEPRARLDREVGRDQGDVLFSRLKADQPINPSHRKPSTSAAEARRRQGHRAAVPGQGGGPQRHDDAGLARKASDALAAVGFSVGAPGNERPPP